MTSCSSLKRKTVRTVIFWGLIYFMGIPAFSQTQLTPKLEIFAGAEFQSAIYIALPTVHLI